MSIRPVKKLITAKATLEGAGVHLRRAFGLGQTSDYDPFWYGPIVMNTQAGVQQAFGELEQGTFL